MKSIVLFILLFSSLAVLPLKAQYGFGTNAPDPQAVIDANDPNKGILVPRLALVATNNISPFTSTPTTSMLVYNTATAGVAPNNVIPGFYYWNGTAWAKLIADTQTDALSVAKSAKVNWFHMPAVSFNTSANGTGFTRDLYELYYEQFTGTDLIDIPDVPPSEPRGPNIVASAGAPSAVPTIPARTDLYYYITNYDSSVLSNISIDANGIMTYDVISTATECSIVNIVFVLK